MVVELLTELFSSNSTVVDGMVGTGYDTDVFLIHCSVFLVDYRMCLIVYLLMLECTVRGLRLRIDFFPLAWFDSPLKIAVRMIQIQCKSVFPWPVCRPFVRQCV